MSWEYYKINLDERARIYTRFFQTIALPGSIITLLFSGIVFTNKNKNSSEVSDSANNSMQSLISNEIVILMVASILGVLCLAGLSMYILHCHEERVSKDYLNFMKSVRSKISEDHPNITPYLKMDPDEKDCQKSRPFGTASSWRVETMAILNSMLFLFSAIFFSIASGLNINSLDNFELLAIYAFVYAGSWVLHQRIRVKIITHNEL